MTRLTTPTLSFNLPFEVEHIDKVLVTFSQNGTIVLEKDETELTMEDKVIQASLAQEETKLFDANADLNIQVRILTVEGEALASRILSLHVNQVLNDDVLGGDSE